MNCPSGTDVRDCYNNQMLKTTTMYSLKDTDLLMTESKPGKREVRQYQLKMRDLPNEAKPREKMLEHGVKALSLQELLALMLNVGTKKEDILRMSQRLVREYGNSALADQTDPQALSEGLNIPLGKACQIIACTEIGRRLYKRHEGGLATIRTAKDVHDFLKDMHSLPKEQLRGLYLDTHNRVIHQEVISIGTINSNIVHPREVFRPALEYGAAAVVLAHNHPSGVATPSTADIEITRQIVDAGKMLGIHLLDHVIIAGADFSSIEVEY